MNPKAFIRLVEYQTFINKTPKGKVHTKNNKQIVFPIISILIILCSNSAIQTTSGNPSDNITISTVTLMEAPVDTVYANDYFIVKAKLDSPIYDEDHKFVELFYKVGESGSWISMGTHETHYIIMDQTIWGSGTVYQIVSALNCGAAGGSRLYFRAVFGGDSEIDPCTAETSIDVIIRPTSIALEPKVATVSGSYPFYVYSKLSSFNSDMEGKAIELFYKVGASGSWTSMGTTVAQYVSGDVLLSGDGVVIRTFDPVTYGAAAGSTVYFKAVYAGDSVYAPCSIEGGTHFVVPEYPIGILGVLFSCFLAFKFSNKLKLKI